MADNNIADISTFEQLQNQANTSFNNSQISLFNNNKKENTAIANIDARELITLIATIDTLEDKSDDYTKAVTQKDTTGAETIKTSAKIQLDKVITRLTELEKEVSQNQNDINRDQRQIQGARNRIEAARRILKL
jgi:hypothetical protein